MPDQTKIEARNGSPAGLARDVGEFAHDVLTLAELQAQLFAADVQECGRRVLVPALVLAAGVSLGWACFPIALAALALVLVEVFQSSSAVAFVTTALVGGMVSALCCAIGWSQIRRRVAVLRRSQQELVRNLRWIKKVLERSPITRENRIDNSWRTPT